MLKQLLTSLILLFTSSSLLLADVDHDILLRGILKLGDNQAFSISTKGGTESQWLKVGQSFNGYTIEAFDEKTEMLTIRKGTETFEIGMTGAELSEASGTPEERLAEAQKIMQLLNFEKMINDTMDGQMKAMTDMMRQQMQQMGQEVDEELMEFQGKAMQRMFEDIDWEPIEKGMAEVYANVFTKEELKGVSSFYTTPAGQATIEKMPEIQAKSMQVMMPAIMQASQKMQQEMMQYMQERQKQEAGKED